MKKFHICVLSLIFIAAFLSDVMAQNLPASANEPAGSDIADVTAPVRDWYERDQVRFSAPIQNRFTLAIYGKFQLDTIWEETRSYPGYYALYGFSEHLHRNDEQFYMTANQSRLGFAFLAPSSEGKSLSGLFEFDLMGEPVHGTPDFNLRHAYLVFAWGRNWELLAGQTWDVISPLRPPVLEWNNGWGWGNIGYWHPQLRLTYRNSPLDAQIAMSAPVGSDADRNGVDDGQDAFLPNLQGRIGFKINKLAFGFSGHWGRQELRFHDSYPIYIDTWSANLDLAFPIKHLVMVTFEYFVGENLEGYMGGVMQGIHVFQDSPGVTVVEAFPAQGGWLNLGFNKGKWKGNIGCAMDVVPKSSLSIGDRHENLVPWGNVLYELYPNLYAGFQFTHIETLYLGYSKGEPNRYQGTLIYSF